MNDRGRVLIVEDDPGLRAMLVDALGHEGYACVQAGSLAEARAVVASEVAHAIQRHGDGIALMLLDLNLPDGSGESLLPQLRRNLDIPVIAHRFSTIPRLAQDTAHPSSLAFQAATKAYLLAVVVLSDKEIGQLLITGACRK